MALSYLNGIGQNAMIRSHVGKIETNIELLFLSEEEALYESYVYFKTVYWLKERDTVFKKSDLTYSNDRLRVNIEGFKSIPSCDIIINKIRNASLVERMRNQLNDSIALHIGSDNKGMTEQTSVLNSYDISEECHNEFESEYSKWFEGQLSMIYSIKNSKIQRFEQIENAKTLDVYFVTEFLNDFGSCEVDFKALELIILKDADLLLTVLNTWSDIEFNRFKWKLDDFKYLKSKDLVIQQLKSSKVSSARQRVLIKIFKKVTV